MPTGSVSIMTLLVAIFQSRTDFSQQIIDLQEAEPA